jgi:small subunit ribosomal protein S8
MALNDLTADMLTRIRNGVRNREKMVTCLSNKLNRGVAKVLKEEGFIRDFELVEDGRQGLIRVHLKYGQRGEQIINKIQKVSKVGCRVYRGATELPKPLQGLGIAIISTSHGVMSDRQCLAANIGGEIVAEVF